MNADRIGQTVFDRRLSAFIGGHSFLQRRFAAVVVADADGFGYFVHKNLPVADFARARRFDQRLNHFFRRASGTTISTLILGSRST